MGYLLEEELVGYPRGTAVVSVAGGRVAPPAKPLDVCRAAPECGCRDGVGPRYQAARWYS